jgi:hypothetical protein
MVPMARMNPQKSNVCFAISIEAGTSNSFSPIGIVGIPVDHFVRAQPQ